MNKPLDNKNPELEAAMRLWNEALSEKNKLFKITHNNAKEYTFSARELKHLVKNYTIQELARQEVDDVINLDALPRVGVSPSNKVRVFYDLTCGRFVVWTPKETKIKS